MERDRGSQSENDSRRRRSSTNGESDYMVRDDRAYKKQRLGSPQGHKSDAVAEEKWPSHKIVKLNVGGQKYMTTIATLRRVKGSLLEAMFAGATAPTQDDEGAYFIDRDGTFFSLILNHLRDGSIDLPAEPVVLRALLREALYYQLVSLANQIQHALGMALTVAPSAPSSPMFAAQTRSAAAPVSRERAAVTAKVTDPKVDALRDLAREPSREHTREPPRDYAPRDSVREPAREHSSRDRDHVRESARDAYAREPPRESAAREHVRESSRDSTRESTREPPREPVREPARPAVRESHRIKGVSRLASHNVAEDRSVKIITCIDFDPAGDHFAASMLTDRISIYNYVAFLNAGDKNPIAAQTLPVKSKLTSISWNKGLRHLLAHSDHEGNICLWNTETGQLVSTFEEHKKRVWSVSFASAAHPTQFASASDDRTVQLWTLDDKKPIGSISSKAAVCCARYSPNDSVLAFSAADHYVHCYDVRNLKTAFAVMRDHRKAVWGISFLNQDELVSASVDGTIKRWHMQKELPSMSYTGHVNVKNFTGLTTDQTGEHIICGSEDNQVYLWHVDTPTPLTSYSFGENTGSTAKWVSTVCPKPDSHVFVGGNSGGDLHIFKASF